MGQRLADAALVDVPVSMRVPVMRCVIVPRVMAVIRGGGLCPGRCHAGWRRVGVRGFMRGVVVASMIVIVYSMAVCGVIGLGTMVVIV